MKVIALYHPKSEHGRKVEEFCEHMHRFKAQEVEALSLESKEGAQMARLYDIVRYPALLAVDNNGVLVKAWQEEKLPLLDEVSAYLTGRP